MKDNPEEPVHGFYRGKEMTNEDANKIIDEINSLLHGYHLYDAANLLCYILSIPIFDCGNNEEIKIYKSNVLDALDIALFKCLLTGYALSCKEHRKLIKDTINDSFDLIDKGEQMKDNPEELIHGSKEWLEFRSNKITATDATAIMCVNPWNTPRDLFEIKIGLKIVPETDAMRWGKEMEPIAFHYLSEFTGIEFTFNKVKIHPKNDWMMATFDGIDEKGKNLAEVKCPKGRKDHDYARTFKKAPEKYYPQLQHQMEVFDVEKIIYFSFFVDSQNPHCPPDIVYFEVFRDDDYIKKMVAKEKEFWDKLQNFTPPDEEPSKIIYRNDDFWKDTEKKFSEAKKQREYWEEQEERYKQTLVSLADDKECKGSIIQLSKVYRKGNVDYSKVPELKNVDLEPYRKEVTKSWRITNI